MRVHEAKTRALAMPYKNSETSQQKPRKALGLKVFNKISIRAPNLSNSESLPTQTQKGSKRYMTMKLAN